jgi:predicted AlkP superfamily pyrophosphatase or phosphodiesterase
MQVNSSVLLAFRADPPTTTVQRVKALLSGSLPTFVDVGTVFAGARIEEDNVFYQAMQHGMRVGAVGDDTWEQLFPRQSTIALNISMPFPSLNVKDLDTVDDGVAHVCSFHLQNWLFWYILQMLSHADGTQEAVPPSKLPPSRTRLVSAAILVFSYALLVFSYALIDPSSLQP